MTDRELLDRAAVAAGRRITGWNTAQGEEVAVLEDGSFWQPLHKNRITDADGDALRLAVELRIPVQHGGPYAVAYAGKSVISNQVTERHGTDPNAATRRAITRAAAAMAPAEPAQAPAPPGAKEA